MSVSVKQERHDEAEIRELAAKFVEANKAKMAITPGTVQQPIFNLFSSGKSKPEQTVCETETKNIDEDSAKGRFGWSIVGKIHIPYIIRSGEKYCAVRMLEMKVLNKLLTCLHQDLYNCTNIRSYYISEAEVKLLNEINAIHCDYQFGREQFTFRDLIVSLKDADEFYQFLEHCYAKLINTVDAVTLGRCGFIRINRESVVPFTVYDGQKYVPLFYFEGETDNLKLKADKLEGWDLSYLKFCCKVQGIRNELYAHDSCSVISLNDIKNYFPPGTLFEDYWPKKNIDSQLLINRSYNPQQIVQWTRQPIAAPKTNSTPACKAKVTPKVPTSNYMQNVNLYSNYGQMTRQHPYAGHGQPRLLNNMAATPTYSTANRVKTYSSSIRQPQPQSSLIRPSAVNIQEQYNVHSKAAPATSNYMVMGNQRYEDPQTSRYMGNMVDPVGNKDYQSNCMMSNAQTHYAPATEDRTNTVVNGVSPVFNNQNKPAAIPDVSLTTGNRIPYKIHKSLIDGKMVPCINRTPTNMWSDMLVSLHDLVKNFFNNVPIHSCQHAMQILGIEVYQANPAQVSLLFEGQNVNDNENVPLVQVRSVINFMPQLKYMLCGMSGSVAKPTT